MAEVNAPLEITLLGAPYTLTGQYIGGAAAAAGTAASQNGGFSVGYGVLQSDGTYAPFAFKDAPSLNGVFSDLVKDIKGKLGLSGDSGFDPLSDLTAKVASVPGLSSLIAEVEAAQVKITLLFIDTVHKQFNFGFGLDFSANPITIGSKSSNLNVQVTSFGFVYNHTSS